MDSDLLIKCFIAFCIVAIVCNLIYSSKLCNKDLVEGQEGICSGSGSGSGSDASCSNFDSASCTGPCIWTETGPPDPPYTPYNKAINDINENIFNKSIKVTLLDIINKTSGVIDVNLMPKSIDATTTFDQFGDNEDALNFLEMIVQKIIGMDDLSFKTFMYNLGGGATRYCENDINEYIISIILLQYNKIKSDRKDSYINISNRLSRYIPDILEKVQNVNSTCEDEDISARSNIMDVMFYRLFQNNNTIINIGSLDALVSELNKLDKVYGVVILLCITYIVVKIFGMFNMKLEV
jgi:hypothetical protein